MHPNKIIMDDFTEVVMYTKRPRIREGAIQRLVGIEGWIGGGSLWETAASEAGFREN